MRSGVFQQLAPDAAPRRVDNAKKRGVVVRVGEEFQVGQHVAHLLALEEAHAAGNKVRDAFLTEGLLQGAREVVGPQQHSKVIEAIGVADHQGADPGSDMFCLVHFRFRRILFYEIPLRKPCPEGLLLALAVAGDERVCRPQDCLRGPVVLLQGDHRDVWEVSLEAQDVLVACPAPGIDGLVVVPDHTDVAGRAHKKPHEIVLCA